MKIQICLLLYIRFAYLTSGFIVTTAHVDLQTTPNETVEILDVASDLKTISNNLPQSSSTTPYEKLISEMNEEYDESPDFILIGDKSTLIKYDANDIKTGGNAVFVTASQERIASTTSDTFSTTTFSGMPAKVTETNKAEFVTTATTDVLPTNENEIKTLDMATVGVEIGTLQALTWSEGKFADDELTERKVEMPKEVQENKTDGDVDSKNQVTENMEGSLEKRTSTSKRDHLDFIKVHAADDSTTEVSREVSEIAGTRFKMDQRETYASYSIDKDEFHRPEKKYEEKTGATENLVNMSNENPSSTVDDYEFGTTGGCKGTMRGTDQIKIENKEETGPAITASSIGDDQGIFETEAIAEESVINQGIRLDRRLDTLRGSINHSFRTVKNDILKAAKSINKVVESLRSALENFVERLRDDLPKFTAADKPKGGAYPVKKENIHELMNDI